MTIKLKMDEFAEQFQEAGAKKLPCDPTDALDSTFKFNLPYSQGWGRRITLREDIKITIDQNQIRDRMILTYPEVAADYIACNFYLSGGCEINTTYTTSQTSQHTDPAGSYVLSSTGSRGLMIANHGTTLFSSVGITFHQSTLRSFIASLDEELPNHLKHLTGSVEKKNYRRSGNIRPAMITALQQILHCPYQGVIKRAYLESKAIELLVMF